ncbi:MAG: carbohydrate kinase family protein [Dehalococcoidia bacterium]|nr:carbohydrate kinase family protein [Dehalococcoidia bacterium]
MKTTRPELDVVGCGGLFVDYICTVDRVIRDGVGTLENTRVSPSGSASNTIHGLAKLGLKTGFMGAVGDDDQGKGILWNMEKVGVDVSRIKVKTMTKSGSVVTVIDAKGSRATYVSSGANDLLSRSDVDMGFACSARYLHLSPFAGMKQFSVLLDLAECPGERMQVTFSPGMVYSRLGLGTLAPLLRRTSILFLNREQLQALTGEDVEAGARICHAQGVKTTVVVMESGVQREDGIAAAYVLDGSESMWIMSGPIELRAPVGTSVVDAFATGFLMGLIRQKPLRVCGLVGDAVARILVSGTGVRDGLPSLTELERRFPGIAAT